MSHLNVCQHMLRIPTRTSTNTYMRIVMMMFLLLSVLEHQYWLLILSNITLLNYYRNMVDDYYVFNEMTTQQK